ncbi:MAG: TadE/TadG family type IV pilus assembly protein [Rhodomicrobium sp.]
MTGTAHNYWPHLDKRGSTALEFGIVLPVLLLFLLGIIDMGRLMWTYTTLYRASEAAARCAAVNTVACGTTAQIQNDAAAESWGMTVAPSTFSVSNPSCGVQVAASFSFRFYTPGFSSITLAPSACFTSLHTSS